jgi:hypothetical protein
MSEQPEWPQFTEQQAAAETKRARSNAMALLGVILLAIGAVGLVRSGYIGGLVFALIGGGLLIAGLVTRP